MNNVTNFATANLVGPISSSDSIIYVDSGSSLINFPSVPFKGLIVKTNYGSSVEAFNNNKAEIVKINTINATALSIDRGLENTSASNFSDGDLEIQVTLTAGEFEILQLASQSLSTRVTQNESDISNNSSSFESRITQNDSDIENNSSSFENRITQITSSQWETEGSDIRYTTGNVYIDGNLTAEEYILSSSVINRTIYYSSGSTIFGDTVDDTHEFTGSIYAQNDIIVDGNVDGIDLQNFSGSTSTRLTTLENSTTTYLIKSSSYTASLGEHIYANTSSSTWTLTLPSGSNSELKEKSVKVYDYGDYWGTNKLIVDGNGATIDDSGSFDCDVSNTNGANYEVMFLHNNIKWEVF